MILFRYINKQVFITLIAVTSILLLMVIGGRFIKYLAEAAAGEMSASILFSVVGYRIPGFLELILPLSLFIAILLAYGRLYMDSEMIVMSSTGMSQARLLRITLFPATIVAILVAFLSLAITPAGVYQFEKLVAEDKTLVDFSMLDPGRFQTLGNKRKFNVYVESVDKDERLLNNIFLTDKGKRETADGEFEETEIIITAPTGTFIVDDKTGSRYLILKNGHRYEGVHQQKNYLVTSFETASKKIANEQGMTRIRELDALPTVKLLESTDLEDIATLQWRIALPVLVFVMVFLAVPLSRVNPRQGRFLRLLPAILMYMAYLALLIFTRGFIEDGKLPPAIGMWWVHVLFLLIGMLLIAWPTFVRRWRIFKVSK